ncbi:RING zinc finger protein, putative [Hepatocystis sp. ex Piliocolobus tephrosceles]|nr:RING zinc finger protein, putative [Hepatocystis sp. ex Piliocolobus tephrosceles]
MSENLCEKINNNMENIRNNVIKAFENLRQIDNIYVNNVRTEIQKKVNSLLYKCLPLSEDKKIINERRFIVIIEKDKNKYDNFRCPICMLILFQPVQTQCKHIYCKECIEATLKKYNHCPLCREVTSNQTLTDLPISYFGREYTNIKIRCYKCKQITTIEKYEQHLKNHINYYDTYDKTNLFYKNNFSTNSIFCFGNKNYKNNYSNYNSYLERTVKNLKNIKTLFNKKIRINEMNTFLLYIENISIITDIYSIQLVYGRKVFNEAIYLEKSHITADFEKNRTNDFFLIIKLKKKQKKKQKTDASAVSTTAVPTTGVRPNSIEIQKKKGMEHFEKYNKKINTFETYESYKTYIHKKINKKKNKTHEYLYIIFEYNINSLFFTIMEYIPFFKDIHITNIITYKINKWKENVRSDEIDLNNITPNDYNSTNSNIAKINLVDIFITLNKMTEMHKNKSSTFSYNSVNIFQEFVDLYVQKRN